MNTGELIKGLAQRSRITQREARTLIQLYMESITRHLTAGRSVVLRGFGTFHLKETKARTGYLPSAGKKMLLPPKRNAAFRAADKLKDSMSDWRPS